MRHKNDLEFLEWLKNYLINVGHAKPKSYAIKRINSIIEIMKGII